MAKICKGDTVLVITGKDKNRTGVVERVFHKTDKVVVTGLNIVKKHLKKSSKYPQGGIIDKSMPIHVSNVMLLDPQSNKPTRIGYAGEATTKHRVAKLSNQAIKDGERK